MPFNFRERPQSGQSTSNPPTFLTKWTASGSSDRAYVKSYALAATPNIVATVQGTLYRQDLRIDPAGAEVFYVDVPYAQFKRETGSYRLSFDTTGGTIHISNSLESIRRYNSSTNELGSAAASAIPKHNGAINVKDGEVEGTDKFIPALKLNVVFRHPFAIITLPHIKNLSRWTGCVNNDTFLTFAAGEVLFLGAIGNEGTDCETDVTYQFACSQNATGLTIGDIAGVAKKGHEYLWISYKDNPSANRAARQPEFVYIERIYDEIAMALSLGFGS